MYQRRQRHSLGYVGLGGAYAIVSLGFAALALGAGFYFGRKRRQR